MLFEPVRPQSIVSPSGNNPEKNIGAYFLTKQLALESDRRFNSQYILTIKLASEQLSNLKILSCESGYHSYPQRLRLATNH